MNPSKAANGSWDGDRFAQHAEEVVRTAVGLSAALGAAGDDLRHYLSECTAQKPLTTLAVALAVGYVVGGGPKTRLLSLLFSIGTSIGTRLAVATITREAAQSRSSAAG